MTPPFETIPYKGCTIKIYADENPESPREWDNLGTMLCKHRDYILGDRTRKEPEPSAETILALTQRPDVLWLPLYLLDHSGISIKCGSPGPNWTSRQNRFVCDDAGWDTSTVGIIYADFATLRKEYAVKHITPAIKKKALHCLELEVETYDDYLTGAVCFFVTEDPEGNVLDSCGGYYPEHERGKEDYAYMKNEARSSIDRWEKKQHAAARAREHNEQQTLQLL